MTVEIIKMSSKGQIVIPQDIRAEMRVSEGTMFAVVSGKDSIVLKKVATPSKEELIRELQIIAKEGAKKAKKLGIKESDIPNLVQKLRNSKKK